MVIIPGLSVPLEGLGKYVRTWDDFGSRLVIEVASWLLIGDLSAVRIDRLLSAWAFRGAGLRIAPPSAGPLRSSLRSSDLSAATQPTRSAPSPTASRRWRRRANAAGPNRRRHYAHWVMCLVVRPLPVWQRGCACGTADPRCCASCIAPDVRHRRWAARSSASTTAPSRAASARARLWST